MDDQNFEKQKNDSDVEIENDSSQFDTAQMPQNTNTNSKKRKIIIGAIAGCVVIIMIVSLLIAQTLNSNTVYNGIKISDIDVSNLTLEQVETTLNKKNVELSEKVIIAEIEGKEEKISNKDINTKYDIKKAAKEAFEVGRKGNIFTRLSAINAAKSGKVINLDFILDDNLIKGKVEEISKNNLQEVVQHKYEISNDNIKFIQGQVGKAIDETDAIEKINKSIKSKEDKVKLNIIVKQPEKLDVEKVYSEVHKAPIDAKLNKETFKIDSEVNGTDISKEKITEVSTKFESGEKQQENAKLTILKPTKTKKMIEDSLYKDVIAEYSSEFVSDANRTENLRIATNFINGKVIMPGQTFSFNNTVGERTSSRGFKEAKIYTQSGVEPGIGGGICQVASTLHNAVVKANLTILERHCHIYAITYVPLGTDAAVYYGSQDFRFKNNFSMPVKIQGFISGNRLYYKVLGTNENGNKTFSLRPIKVSTGYYVTDLITTENGVETKKRVYESYYKPKP